MRVHASALSLTVVLLGAASASAQLEPGSPDAEAVVASLGGDRAPEPSYGTAADIVVTYFAHDFNLVAGTEGPVASSYARTCSSALCFWAAGVKLPAGASVRSLELSACDTDASRQASVSLLMEAKVPGDVTLLDPLVTTGAAATPGCTTVSGTLAAAPTVNNAAFVYFLVASAYTGPNVSWNQVRIRYRLQVSPAPAAATFADVPTSSPYFRYVEALAAAGVVGGCSANNYCPNSAVTRGQMAVFLAVALGMHYPN